jgi:glutamine amidotransferase-like uncharacterized protein
MKTIALFNHHPQCSDQCCKGMMRALEPHYKIKWFTVRDDLKEVVKNVDCIAFPGGIGDSDSFFDYFSRTRSNVISSFIDDGGKYLGICMGAYWAGSRYFDILNNVNCVQYIKRPTAEIRRSYGTVADIEWLGQKEKMFFYDGCTFVGSGRYDTIAKYANDEPMAIIQGNVGIIGCHPESEEFWYEEPYKYLSGYYHDGRHHNLLLEFVNKLWRVG